MSIFTKEERIIIAKKAKDYSEQISMNIAQLSIGKSCYIKGYTDAVVQANGDNKQPNTEALRLQNVMPRLLMEEQLHLKTGSRTLNVRGVKNMDMPHVIISCIEEWQPDSDDEFGESEIDDASYYLTTKEIDMLIDKLREGKAFLNGA